MEKPVETSTDTSKRRWGQARRLAFIDLRLQYDARINRRDLIDFFDISTPQASADLSLYQVLAPDNLRYDASLRVYVAGDSFQPIFGRTSATSYLDEIHRVARNVVEPGESFVGFTPPTGVVATPVRAIEASEVAVLVRAIRDQKALRVVYQSMDDPNPRERVITPHAFGFDGLRWHARAWCHQRRVFRDFAIGRLAVTGAADTADTIEPKADVGWYTVVQVVLIPHPKLSSSQRTVVMHDYGMTNARLLLSCRKAMLFYTLRHLNLESAEVVDNPASQHVIVENRAEVDRWADEDRAGTAGVSP